MVGLLNVDHRAESDGCCLTLAVHLSEHIPHERWRCHRQRTQETANSNDTSNPSRNILIYLLEVFGALISNGETTNKINLKLFSI